MNHKAEPKYVAAYKDGPRLTVAWKYDEENDFWLVMDHYGSNRLVGFKEWRIAGNSETEVSPNFKRPSELLLGEGSDWIGPYIVEAADEGGGTPRQTFTGGNHAYDGNVGGTATARTVSVRIFADGTAKPEREPVRCHSVTIQTVNAVQGYNTKREDGAGAEILHETVTYTFKNGIVNVHNEIEALEPIVIHRYYGLQTVNGVWNGTVQYGGPGGVFGAEFPSYGESDSNIGFDSSAGDSEPDAAFGSAGNPAAPRTTDRFRLRSRDGRHRLTAWLDREVGLGRMEAVQDGLPAAFTMAYGKTYFNLIRGMPLTLHKGGKVSWSGGYRFEAYIKE